MAARAAHKANKFQKVFLQDKMQYFVLVLLNRCSLKVLDHFTHTLKNQRNDNLYQDGAHLYALFDNW